MSTNENEVCNRFEEHGLLLLERGQQLDEHYNGCDDCLEALRVYQALGQLIANSPNTGPKAGWQEAVFDQISSQQESVDLNSSDAISTVSRSPRPWFGAIAAGIAALGIATVFLSDSKLMQGSSETLQAHNLELTVISSNDVYRGSEAKIGDKLAMQTRLEKPEEALLRLYRDGQLYFTCGQQKACKVDDQNLSQSVELNAYGEYQAVIYINSKLTNTPPESIDADVLAAMDSGNEVIISNAVIVR